MAVICVELVTTMLVSGYLGADCPGQVKYTIAPESKLLPFIVIVSPGFPFDGVTPETMGDPG